MAFYGSEFIYDEMSCGAFGMMLYNIGDGEEGGTFTSPGEIVEDRIANRHSSLYYGRVQNSPLSFPITFGIVNDRIDNQQWLTRSEMKQIADWLLKDGYKKLVVCQDDMRLYYYKAIITELRYETFGHEPFAVTCTVQCDSPYAYTEPIDFIFNTSYGTNFEVNSEQSVKYYYPIVTIQPTSSSLTISNESDFGRSLKLSSIGSVDTITIDCQNEIITMSDGTNGYEVMDFANGSKFLRILRGENIFTVTGSAVITIRCEYPVDIGG